MFFEWKGVTYEIRFKKFGKSTTTVAEILKVTADGIIHLGIYGIATVYRWDRYNEILGNKVALTNLLSGLGTDDSMPPFPKEAREIIWTKFFETFKR